MPHILGHSKISAMQFEFCPKIKKTTGTASSGCFYPGEYIRVQLSIGTDFVRVVFDNVYPATSTVKLDETFRQSKKREIRTDTNTFSGMKPCPYLSNKNISGNHSFTTVFFHTTPLPVGIATVSTGTLTFFMCHWKTSLIRKLL